MTLRARQAIPVYGFFRVRRSALVVLAVLHGRRDPAIWQRRA